MYVINSLGNKEQFSPEKVVDKLNQLVEGLAIYVDPDLVAQKTIAQMVDGMTTKDIDYLSASVAESYGIKDPDYLSLGGRILAKRLQQDNPSFIDSTVKLYEAGYLSDSYYHKVLAYNKDNSIESIIDHSADFKFNYMAMRTLIGNSGKGARLLSVNGVTVETPQYMFMRCAIHCTNTYQEAINIYKDYSSLLISLPSPVMFNSGTKTASLISCNLVSPLRDNVLGHTNSDPDSLEGMHKTYYQLSKLSSRSAGLGFNITPYRSKKTNISTSGGKAAGLLKQLKVEEALMSTYNQSGKRAGSMAVYIEPWHKDFLDVMKAARPHTEHSSRAMDLFYAVWMCDLFMKRLVEGNDEWYLFCPYELSKVGIDLNNLHNEKFEEAYNKAVSLGLGEKVSLKHIAEEIAVTCIEAGKPYMLFKDSVNRHNMQKHLGTIKSSNLCAETVQYTDDITVANCVLGSINLPMLVTKELTIDYKRFKTAVRNLVFSLNHICNINDYPTEEAYKGGSTQRALGIGVVGLTDLFVKLGISFDSEAAKTINKQLFKDLYKFSVEASIEYAKQYGGFHNTPYSEGELAFDSYHVHDIRPDEWKYIRENAKQYGIANTLLIALMPTASSGNIVDSEACFEPYKHLIYNKDIEGNRYLVVNKYLYKDLRKAGIMSNNLINDIIANGGTIDGLDLLKHIDKPDQETIDKANHISKLYRSAYSQGMNKAIIDLAADRQPFVDQSQSMNLFTKSRDISTFWSMIVYGWKKELKTGMYYLRTLSETKADQSLAIQPINVQSNNVCENGGCEV